MAPFRAIDPGELNTRITLERPVLADDSSGTGKTTTWAEIATNPSPWARVRPVSGQERTLAAQVDATTRYRVVIRRRGDLTEDMRVVWLGKNMNITAIADPGPKEAFMTLDCTAGEAS